MRVFFLRALIGRSPAELEPARGGAGGKTPPGGGANQPGGGPTRLRGSTAPSGSNRWCPASSSPSYR
ncbi:MAG: hypothetical protein E6G56_15815 [Actinobacteria bacterium]|nr:MAG: hypothetical protein E6G56_15815 [Actinomycetota bacterium]